MRRFSCVVEGAETTLSIGHLYNQCARVMEDVDPTRPDGPRALNGVYAPERVRREAALRLDVEKMTLTLQTMRSIIKEKVLVDRGGATLEAATAAAAAAAARGASTTTTTTAGAGAGAGAAALVADGGGAGTGTAGADAAGAGAR